MMKGKSTLIQYDFVGDKIRETASIKGSRWKGGTIGEVKDYYSRPLEENGNAGIKANWRQLLSLAINYLLTTQVC